MERLKVAFCGTPEFCLPSLETLHQSPAVDLKYVVSMPGRPAGRGRRPLDPAVASYARKHELALIQTPDLNAEEEVINQFERESLDMIVVIAFAQFLGKRLLALPRLGCFNLHASLLPRWRGAAPIQYALLNGDSETGVSIQKMVRQMDAGDIFWQGKVPISENTNQEELFTKLSRIAVIGICELIKAAQNGHILLTPQDENKASFAPTLKKSDGLLRFRKASARKLCRQVRAFYPWPGSYFFLNGLRAKVHRAEESGRELAPGEVETRWGSLLVGCREGCLHLTRIQLEGKKAMPDDELLRGLANRFSHFELSEET